MEKIPTIKPEDDLLLYQVDSNLRVLIRTVNELIDEAWDLKERVERIERTGELESDKPSDDEPTSDKPISPETRYLGSNQLHAIDYLLRACPVRGLSVGYLRKFITSLRQFSSKTLAKELSKLGYVQTSTTVGPEFKEAICLPERASENGEYDHRKLMYHILLKASNYSRLTSSGLPFTRICHWMNTHPSSIVGLKIADEVAHGIGNDLIYKSGRNYFLTEKGKAYATELTSDEK